MESRKYRLAANIDRCRRFGVSDCERLVKSAYSFLLGIIFTFETLDEHSKGDFKSIFGAHRTLSIVSISKYEIIFESADSDFVHSIRERFFQYGIEIFLVVQ